MSAQRRNHRIEENPGGEGASGRVESKRLTQNSRQVVDGAPVGDGETSSEHVISIPEGLPDGAAGELTYVSGLWYV